MSGNGEVKSIIDSHKMSFVQYSTIFICLLMNMLDGMDVLVIAYTASSITKEWSVEPEALGIVFSAALFGMTLGALFIAPLADKIGRKEIILACASVMGVSIYLTSLVLSVGELVTLRFVSGLGIGGMLASASTLVSEYAPNRSKDFWVSLVMGGYPLGAVLSGMAASYIVPTLGWRAMFQFAGLATIATIPLTVFGLSQSLEFLIKTQPKDALKKVNKILRKMKLDALDSLPVLEEKVHSASLKYLFAGERKTQTIFLWVAFFMTFTTLYFLTSWIPKLTTVSGLSEELGIYAATVFNLGAFAGILLLGAMAMRFGLRKTIIAFLITAAIVMCVFGAFSGSLMVLILFGLVGFFMQGGFVGLYPLAARIYPVEVRSTGIGWAIGAGRLGAVIGPILAGYLIGAHVSMLINFIIFAIPCVVAAFAVISIGLRSKNRAYANA